MIIVYIGFKREDIYCSKFLRIYTSFLSLYDIAMKRGYDALGSRFKKTLINDSHADGSIDIELIKGMIALDDEMMSHYYEGVPQVLSMRDHELYPFVRKYAQDSPKNTVKSIVGMYQARIDDEAEMILGGSDKEILERGTDWCTDVARLGVTLFMCADLPSRLVYLCDTDKDNWGHCINEVYFDDAWHLVDIVNGYILASAKAIYYDKELIKDLPEDYRGYFKAMAVSIYDPLDKDNNYAVSGFNDYYREILKI